MGIKQTYDLTAKDENGKPKELPAGTYYCYKCNNLLSSKPFPAVVKPCEKCGGTVAVVM